MSYASECILCADSTKESQVKRFKLCEPEALSILITDSGLSEEKIMEYREKGIKVILCDCKDGQPEWKKLWLAV